MRLELSGEALERANICGFISVFSSAGHVSGVVVILVGFLVLLEYGDDSGHVLLEHYAFLAFEEESEAEASRAVWNDRMMGA